jgi:dienelactone hydrolase
LTGQPATFSEARSQAAKVSRRARAAVIALCALFVGAGGALCDEAPATSLADGRSGKIHFESVTPTGYFELARRTATQKAVVFGTLLLPAQPAGRVPAMVIAHGSGGVSDPREFWWARQFVGLGVAAFVVDSFAPRNIHQTATDQGQLSTAANVADALSALRLLATHPRIDPERIGIMGFSKGGQAAIYAALEPFRRAMVGDATRFALHVPLYPYCNDWMVSERTTGAPMLFLLGGRDDYTPAEPCRKYAEWFKSKGAAATVIVYRDAYHGFDTIGSPVSLAHVVTGRKCDGQLDLDRFKVTVRTTGQDITATARDYFRGCMGKGAMVGGDDEAKRRAPADVKAFVKSTFKL